MTSLIQSLRGHTTTFMVADRATDLFLGREMIGLLGQSRHVVILDIDAAYSSNSDYIFSHLTEPQTLEVTMLVPDPRSGLEAELGELTESGAAQAIVIDNLNSLFHFIEGEKRGGRKLAFVMAWLSYLARTEGRIVVLTMYQRERIARIGRNAKLSDLSDSTISVSMGDGGLKLKGERGQVLMSGETWLPSHP